MHDTELRTQAGEGTPVVRHTAGSRWRLAAALVASVALILALAASGLAYSSTIYDGRIYPGVSAAGVDLSGKTPQEARRELRRRAGEYGRAPRVLRHGDRVWRVTPEELGFALDAAPLLREAYDHGRTGPILQRWRRRLPMVNRPTEINAYYVADRAKVEAYIRDLSSEIRREPVNSMLSVRRDGTLVASAERAGQELDTTAATDELYDLIVGLGRDEVRLPVLPIEPSQTREGWRSLPRLRAEAAAKPVTLTYRRRSWTLRPDQLARAIVVEKAGGDVVGRFDARRLEKLLTGVAADVGRRPKDARLRLEDAKPLLVEEKPGQRLDVEAAVHSILASLPADRRAVVVTKPVAARLTAADLMPAKRKLDALLASPITLRHPDGRVRVPVETIAGWVRLMVDTQSRSASVRLDEAAVHEYMHEVEAEIGREPQNGKLTWDNGLVIAEASVDGYALDTDKATDQLMKLAWSAGRSLTLPVALTKPRVPTDSPTALGIKEVIGEGSSEFTGSSPARVHNIRTGARYLDNTVTAPGETFSFNDALGEISLARGYKEAPTIVADATIPGVGGGICQVSTTMFRAAFWAGLPIDERRAHSY
ncbi:MAG: peptidoglycan binding domain-containing protein, partial [Chloroflexota bacterium]|nr:peptidoglycan binding domain-containing protein [Chloroflexota bacterium]